MQNISKSNQQQPRKDKKTPVARSGPKKEEKEQQKMEKQQKKIDELMNQKIDTKSQPKFKHEKDRKSGTGKVKETKKSGGGKYNWGQDEMLDEDVSPVEEIEEQQNEYEQDQTEPTLVEFEARAGVKKTKPIKQKKPEFNPNDEDEFPILK